MNGIDSTRMIGIASDLSAARNAEALVSGAAPLVPGQQKFSSAWSLVVSMLECLPLIGDSDVVKAWAAEIKLGNTIQTERLSSLVEGLEKQYGTEAKNRAVAVTHLRKSTPLDGRTVKAAHDVAKAHHQRAEARDYANHVQLEVWTRKGSTRFGHVALSVAHAMQQDGTLSTNQKWDNPTEQTYMSWLPSGLVTVPRMVEGAGNIVAHELVQFARKMMLLERPVRLPRTSEDYESDMAFETSDRTREALSAGQFHPKENQVRVKITGSDGELEDTWGTHADSRLAVPMMGDNYSRKTNQTQFAYFGLNERDLREGWNVLTETANMSTLVFDAVSTDANCAGRATQLLRSAGAEAYLPLPKATFLQDPNALDAYGRNLMNVVSELNAKAAVVDQAFRPMRDWAFAETQEPGAVVIPRPAGPLPPAPAFMPGETQPHSADWVVPPTTQAIHSEFRKRFGTTLAQGLARQIEVLGNNDPLFVHLTPLRAALKQVAASDAGDFKTLTSHCKVLVNALHGYATQPIDAQAVPFLVRAHGALATLQAACNSVCRLDKQDIVPGAGEAVSESVVDEAHVVAVEEAPHQRDNNRQPRARGRRRPQGNRAHRA